MVDRPDVVTEPEDPMSDTATSLLQQALTLNPDERYELARQLLDSLDADDPLPDDPTWRAELDRRVRSLSDGTADLKSWEEAKVEIDAELARRRAARNAGAGS